MKLEPAVWQLIVSARFAQHVQTVHTRPGVALQPRIECALIAQFVLLASSRKSHAQQLEIVSARRALLAYRGHHMRLAPALYQLIQIVFAALAPNVLQALMKSCRAMGPWIGSACPAQLAKMLRNMKLELARPSRIESARIAQIPSL